MPRISSTVERVARPSSEGAAALALIAAPGARERIGAILRARGLEFTAIGDSAGLRDGDLSEVAMLILHRGEDTEAAQQIALLRGAAPEAPIVLVCAAIQRWEMRAALSAGVAGVVIEDEMTSTLSVCLDAVRAGQICVPQQHWRQIEPPALSTREKQILGLVVMGYMNGQIAERLFLAESTVKSHLSSAFGKLGVRSRNEAVNLILDSKRGLGMGILALGGEPLETSSTATG